MLYVYGRTQPLARYPIEQCLRVIRDLGFDGVEVCLENEDIAPALLDDHTIGRVCAALEELALQSFSVSYHRDYIYSDEELERTIQAIRATPRLGAGIFVFSGGRKRTRDKAEWERTVERTRLLVAAAEACGVVLAKEFEPDFCVGSTAELLGLFDEIPSRIWPPTWTWDTSSCAIPTRCRRSVTSGKRSCTSTLRTWPRECTITSCLGRGTWTWASTWRRWPRSGSAAERRWTCTSRTMSRSLPRRSHTSGGCGHEFRLFLSR